MNIYEIKDLVDSYMERNGLKLKKSSLNIDNKTYEVTTTDYTDLKAKMGKTKLIFKVDGKVASIYK